MELDGNRAYLVAEIKNTLHEAPEVQTIKDLHDQFLELMECERVTIYRCDSHTHELVSFLKTGKDLDEIRLPINFNSVIGFAVSARQTITIDDAYDQKELKSIDNRLKFDHSWDDKSGYRTKEILATPLIYAEKYILGAIQFLGKEDRFDDEDTIILGEICASITHVIHKEAIDVTRPDTPAGYDNSDLITLLTNAGYWDPASAHRQDPVEIIKKLIADKEKAENKVKTIKDAFDL